MSHEIILLIMWIGTALFTFMAISVSLLLIYKILFRGGYQRYVDQEIEAQEKQNNTLDPLADSIFKLWFISFVGSPLTLSILAILILVVWFYAITTVTGLNIESLLLIQILCGLVVTFGLVISANQVSHALKEQSKKEKIFTKIEGINEYKFLQWRSKLKNAVKEGDIIRLSKSLSKTDNLKTAKFIQKLISDEENIELLLEISKQIEASVLPRKALAWQRTIIRNQLTHYWIDVEGQQKIPDMLRDLPLFASVELKGTRLKEPYLTIKRAIDFSLALFLFFLVIGPLPILPLITLALLIQFHGVEPIFYVSKRAGLYGKPFLLYQFRTNVPNKVTGGHEPSRLGNFLIWSGLDRLPILVNIIKGEMSFVGPYGFYLDWMHYLIGFQIIEFEDLAWRQAVRPGMTGVSQVAELRKPDTYLDPNSLKREIAYIKNWSLKTDFKIIWETFLLYVMFMFPNALLSLFSKRKLPPVDAAIIQLPKWLELKQENKTEVQTSF